MPKFFNTIEAQVGDFTIQNSADDKDIAFKSDNGSGGLSTYFELDGSNTRMNSKVDFRFDDNAQLQLGGGSDLRLSHNGTDSSINNYTGNLNIQQRADDSDIVFQCDDGGGSLADYIRIDGSEVRTLFSVNAEFSDNVKAKFGSSDDLAIYHDGSNSYIDDSGTGNLKIRTNFLTIEKYNNGEIMASFDDDNAVSLYHNNSQKFATTSSGISVTGGIALSGDVEGRKIPCIVTTGWGDDVSTTSNRIIPLGNSTTDTTVSSADGFHFVVMPYAGNVKKIVMKNVAGSLSSSFTTELKLYKNGANVTSSGELTASSSAITWEPSSSNTFSANDEISLVYQKSASSKYWREVSLTMVLEFTGQDI
jgi:hypothetical protein